MSKKTLKSKDELKENIIEVINEIKKDRKKSKQLKEAATEYIDAGTMQTYINEAKDAIYSLNEQDLYILSEKLFEVTSKSTVYPNDYFTDRQIKEVKTNYEPEKVEKVTFPYTFENVTKVSDSEDDFITVISGRDIVRFMNSGLLQYNPETQREARMVKSKEDPNKIIPVPKLIDKAVKEMVELIKKGQLISTMITFNARQDSSDEGAELMYDEEDKTLTVTKGTLLDVLDGFHRINATVIALFNNPELKVDFKLNILNYDKERARQYFAQLNKANPVSKSQIKSMEQKRFGDFVAEKLKYSSELKDKIYPADRLPASSPLLVTFGTLADAIDEVFDIQDKPEAIQVFKYLKQFIEELFFSYPEAFYRDVTGIRKDSLINVNTMFYGYMVLAKRMKEENIDLSEIKDILDKVDFSRNNKLWQTLAITNEEGYIKATAKKGLIEYFTEIKL